MSPALELPSWHHLDVGRPASIGPRAAWAPAVLEQAWPSSEPVVQQLPSRFPISAAGLEAPYVPQVPAVVPAAPSVPARFTAAHAPVEGGAHWAAAGPGRRGDSWSSGSGSGSDPWETLVDAAGREYFHNPVTGEVAWQLPVDVHMVRLGYRRVHVPGTPPYWLQDATGEWCYAAEEWATADAATPHEEATWGTVEQQQQPWSGNQHATPLPQDDQYYHSQVLEAHDSVELPHPAGTSSWSAPSTPSRARYAHPTYADVGYRGSEDDETHRPQRARARGTVSSAAAPSAAGLSSRPPLSRPRVALYCSSDDAPVPRGTGSDTDSADEPGSSSDSEDDSEVEEAEVLRRLEDLDRRDVVPVGLSLRERIVWGKRAAARVTGDVVSNLSGLASALATHATPLVKKAVPVLHRAKSMVEGLCGAGPGGEPGPSLPVYSRSRSAAFEAPSSPAAAAQPRSPGNLAHFRDADGVVYRASIASRRPCPVSAPT